MKALVVCEKPDAAARVARAIDSEGNPWRQELHGVPFFECGTKDGPVVVCSALGHLYAVDSKNLRGRRSYPVWDLGWTPRHAAKGSQRSVERWIRAIGSLAAKADHFVNACDYDIEGSLIGETILQYACNNAHSKASRMKFSSMTEREIRSAYRNVSQTLDFPLVEAGRCRHELDWLYGINLSRIMTESALKENKGYATLSTGRVQGPTLRFVTEKEEEIGYFTPIPYWAIDSAIEHDGRELGIEYYRDKIATQQEAERIVSNCKSSTLEVKSVESAQIQRPPPFPFDLSSLQSEGFRHFGYSPSRTLAIAEKLYLDALISYPRTSSQKLPPDIGYEKILQGLSTGPYKDLATRLLTSRTLIPNQGVRDDPAHPAIYPTGERPSRTLGGPEARLFDMIVRRFMSVFANPSVLQTTRVDLKKDNHLFFLRGLVCLSPGWIEFYKPYASLETQELPPLKIGMQVSISRIENVERFTRPPPRFNSASLLRKMEEEGIGTKATRAEIIEILYRREYVTKPQMEATSLGISLTEFLVQYCPLIVDVDFTSKLEELMEGIQQGKTTRKLVLLEALQHLRPVMLDLVSRERELGARLSGEVTRQRNASVSFETPCPRCGSQLRIVKNRRTGKRFVGCSGKWEKNCSFSLPLPQFGAISILKRTCKVCGFQHIMTRRRGWKPLISCPKCYAKKARDTSGVNLGLNALNESVPKAEAA